VNSNVPFASTKKATVSAKSKMDFKIKASIKVVALSAVFVAVADNFGVAMEGNARMAMPLKSIPATAAAPRTELAKEPNVDRQIQKGLQN